MPTLVYEAKRVARDCATEKARKLPGFHGGYFAGSTTALPDDAELLVMSDFDLNVVLSRAVDTFGESVVSAE